MAVAIIDGWYQPWSHTGEVIAALHNMTNRLEIVASAEPRKTYDACEWKSGQDVVKSLTDFKPKKRRKKKMLSIQQFKKHLEKQ